MASLLKPEREPWAEVKLLTVEELPPNLRQYVCRRGVLPMFYHPFFVSVVPVMLPEWIDLQEMINQREADAEEMLAAGNWGGFVARHERGYRLDAVLTLADTLKGQGVISARQACLFWRIAAEAWVGSELPENDPAYAQVINCGIPHREFMTLCQDRRALMNIADDDDMIRIFRGVQSATLTGAKRACRAGWQWTLSPLVADWFAWRWLSDTPPRDKRSWVATTVIKRTDAVAYLTGRGEREIIVNPKSISIDDVDFRETVKRPKHYSAEEEEIEQ